MDGPVPLIDLAGPGAVAAIADACTTVGFFAVAGHGVPDEVVVTMCDALEVLFALSPDEKLALAPPRPEVNRGYAPPGSESLAYSIGVDSPPDLFEAFNIGPEETANNARLTAARAQPANIWPANIWPAGAGHDDIRRALMAYFGEVRTLAHHLTGLFAEALGLEGSFFEPKTDHSTDMMRCNHYRLAPGAAAAPGQLGMGPHTDYGIVTILYADPLPGLQIVGPDRSWQPVVPEPGTLLVNLGDLLATWTNDHWRSTVHRVLPPLRSTSGEARRQSVAFFHDGNDDALVECLPSCTSADDPPRYAPVRAGDHLRAKLIGPRTLTRSDAASTLGGRLPA